MRRKKEPGDSNRDRDSSGLMDREPYKCEAKPWSNMPPCTADGGQDSAATLAIQGRRRLPFIGGIDIRLAHQLPGKPAAGAGGKHVGSY